LIKEWLVPARAPRFRVSFQALVRNNGVLGYCEKEYIQNELIKEPEMLVNEKEKRKSFHCRGLFAAGLFCIILLVGLPDCWGFRHLKEGEPVPDFKLNDLDGNAHSLSRAKGKAVLVLYWRVGQERSLMALKELKTISKNFTGQPLQILAITKDTYKKIQLIELIKSLDLPFPVLLDTEARVYSEFGVFVFPSAALIDKKGIYRFHYGGFREGYQDELSGQIKLLLGLITEEELKNKKQPNGSELTETKKKALRHIRMGKKLQDKGMDDKARLEFEKAVELDPDNPKAHTALGFSLIARKETGQALESFQKALEMNPRSTDAKMGLGSAYRLQGDTDKALEIYESGIRLCPDSARFHLELGKIYESLGRCKDAAKHFKASAECFLKMEKGKELTKF
jgi:tetratricopeptide (TPR) repeat protein